LRDVLNPQLLAGCVVCYFEKVDVLWNEICKPYLLRKAHPQQGSQCFWRLFKIVANSQLLRVGARFSPLYLTVAARER
jgi:hypothetical protein